MTEKTSALPVYTSGFGDAYVRFLMRRAAESHAAYLLPYLRPGLRVLDMGCGPGTISAGLAKAVEPGELHGVDMEESQVELARSVAEEAGQANAIFHVADITDLPFEDGFFDVAHSHQALSYIPDTQAALAEVKRVLKPGGILGCREIMCESCFIHPDIDGVGRIWDLFEDVLAGDDCHPQMGTEMKSHILEAGFTNIRLTASFDIFSSPTDIAFAHDFLSNWILSPEITEAAIKYSAATEELCENLRAALDKWKDHPGASIMPAYGEAIAGRP